ncbi:4-hydroxybenzoate polyprenyltransferase [Variovorax boronicumulans]|uniref:hypothetical protein n=1 Tax=Variovorax boronicumulans TaxID=436515 RepID=UPI00278722EB|nr:hypothetical protein [Variovorax boronicumulans]MDQ0084563.1 4-hydroxybenzoate polyprenyltransferase [Variovorax boronicumulans]
MIQAIRKFLKPYSHHAAWAMFLAPFVIAMVILCGWWPLAVGVGVLVCVLAYAKAVERFRKWLEATP